jgi:hypothetical protein
MKKIYFITFIIFSLFCCDSKKDDSKLLETYLMQNFSMSIDSSVRYYLFIPYDQCPNCFNINSLKLKQSTYNDVILITSMKKKYFENFNNFYFDIQNKMYNLSFIKYSNTLIVTKDKEIRNIKNNIDIIKELKDIDSGFDFKLH